MQVYEAEGKRLELEVEEVKRQRDVQAAAIVAEAEAAGEAASAAAEVANAALETAEARTEVLRNEVQRLKTEMEVRGQHDSLQRDTRISCDNIMRGLFLVDETLRLGLVIRRFITVWSQWSAFILMLEQKWAE